MIFIFTANTTPLCRLSSLSELIVRNILCVVYMISETKKFYPTVSTDEETHKVLYICKVVTMHDIIDD